MHIRVSTSSDELIVHGKPQTRRKAHSPKCTKRVVEKGSPRGEGGADDATLNVIDALAGPVLNDAGIHVVEEGIDGEVTAHGILLRRAQLNVGDPRVVGVRLGPQVHQVHPQPHHLHACRLQVLGLLRIALDDPDRMLALPRLRLQPLVEELSKRGAEHGVHRNVNVHLWHGAADELIAHPSTGNTQCGVQLLLRNDALDLGKQLLLQLTQHQGHKSARWGVHLEQTHGAWRIRCRVGRRNPIRSHLEASRSGRCCRGRGWPRRPGGRPCQRRRVGPRRCRHGC